MGAERAAREHWHLGNVPGRRRRLPGILMTGTCWLWSAAVAVAQPTETFTDDLQVRLVETRVAVTDAEGRPVTTLDEEDFEILVDGQPVELRAFEPPPAPAPTNPPPAAEARDVSADTTTAPTLTPATLAAGSRLVIFLDLAYLMPGETRPLAEALQDFVDHHLRAGDQITLVAADRHLERVASLEPGQPLAPIFEQLVSRLGRGQRLQVEYDDLLRSIEETTQVEQIDPLLARHPHRETRRLMTRINSLAVDANRDVALTGEQLKLLIGGMAGLPGNRTVLYVGGRLPLTLGQSLHNAWHTAFTRTATRREVAADASTTGPQPANANYQFDTLPVLETPDNGGEVLAAIGRLASARGVTFYTLDASLRGSTLSRSVAESHSPESLTGASLDYRGSQRAAHHQGLAELAEVTGGRALGNRRDLSGLLPEIFAEARATYTLAFAPPATPDPDPGAQEEGERTYDLEVRLVSPHQDLEVRHRRYFRSRPADQEVADRTLSALLIATGDELADPLEIELTFGDPRSADGSVHWPVTLRVPFSLLALRPETWAHSGQLSLFYTAGNLRGGTLPVRKAVIPVRVENEKILDAFGQRIEYSFEIEIPASAGAVAVSVRDDLSTALSTRVYALPSGPFDGVGGLTTGGPGGGR